MFLILFVNILSKAVVDKYYLDFKNNALSKMLYLKSWPYYLVITCTFCTVAYLLLRTLFSEYSPSISTSSRNSRDRYAYATFLSPRKRPSSSSPSRSTSYSDPDSDPDPNPYSTSVRLLTYQLLHDPPYPHTPPTFNPIPSPNPPIRPRLSALHPRL